MIKLAHTVTAYQSVVSILDSKLRHLGNYPDLEVCVISSESPEPESRQPAVRFIPLAMARNISPLADIISIWQMYRLFKRERFDIVHSHTAKAGFITAIAARLAGVRHIYHTSHGLPFYEGQPAGLYKKYKKLEKLACRFRTHLFTQNKHDYNACTELMNGDKTRVSVEGNGVDVDFVINAAQKDMDNARQYYPAAAGLKIAMLCRYEPVKRIEDYFAVLAELKNQGLQFSAIVTGKGPQEQYLRDKLIALGLADRVSVTGYCQYPHSLLALADIVMLCSEKEGIPRVLMEAMALERPVVATNVLGTQELVVDNQTGFLAPLGDIGKLTDGVKKLAVSPQLREQMGMAGKLRVIESFNDVKIAEYLHDFYVKAVNDN